LKRDGLRRCSRSHRTVQVCAPLMTTNKAPFTFSWNTKEPYVAETRQQVGARTPAFQNPRQPQSPDLKSGP
jgi:hypothetical protein